MQRKYNSEDWSGTELGILKLQRASRLARNNRMAEWLEHRTRNDCFLNNRRFESRVSHIFIFRFFVDVIIFEWSSFFQILIDRKNPIGIKTVS